MRNFTIGLAAILLISCGRSSEEQMLYDYQKENVKSGLNMDIEDLDFEIHSIEKDEEIKALDSLTYHKNELAVLWLGDDPDPVEKDTLTYKYVINSIENVREDYHEIMLLNIRAGKEYRNYEYEGKRERMGEALLKAQISQMMYNSYSRNPDSLLSVKYKTSYSINNPMMNNARQTFDKYFYTNSNQSKFIAEDMVE
ncbi:MAG: hypothetical protein ACQEWD_11355 [Bacteroidota bacterium]